MMVVYAPEYVATIPDTTRVLELGCGQVRRVPHSVTLDINPLSIADVIHDLNVTPYPFPDNAFDVVIAEHVLEHLDNVVAVVTELHRITRHAGLIYIEVPHFSSADSFTDPTHKHAFSSRSFDYFVPGTYYSTFKYSPAQFKKRSVRIRGNRGGRRWMLLRSAFERWVNANPETYEDRLAFVLPKRVMNFELEVIKCGGAARNGRH